MIFRIIAAFMFTAVGTLYGFIQSDSLRRKLLFTLETGELMRKIGVYIRNSGMNVYELSGELKRSDEMRTLSFFEYLPEAFSENETYAKQWKSAVMKQSDIPDEERALLLKLGNVIGSCDSDGQLRAFSVLEEELKYIEKERRESVSRKGKLYRSTGTLFGIMAGILII